MRKLLCSLLTASTLLMITPKAYCDDPGTVNNDPVPAQHVLVIPFRNLKPDDQSSFFLEGIYAMASVYLEGIPGVGIVGHKEVMGALNDDAEIKTAYAGAVDNDGASKFIQLMNRKFPAVDSMIFGLCDSIKGSEGVTYVARFVTLVARPGGAEPMMMKASFSWTAPVGRTSMDVEDAAAGLVRSVSRYILRKTQEAAAPLREKKAQLEQRRESLKKKMLGMLTPPERSRYEKAEEEWVKWYAADMELGIFGLDLDNAGAPKTPEPVEPDEILAAIPRLRDLLNERKNLDKEATRLRAKLSLIGNNWNFIDPSRAKFMLKDGTFDETKRMSKQALRSFASGFLALHSEARIRHYSEALRQSSQWPIYLQRGIARFEGGQQEEGLADLNQSIALSPDRPQLYAIRAMMHGYRKDFKSAKQDIDQSLKAAPDFIQAHRLGSELAQSAGDGEKALKHLSAAIALQPSNGGLYLRRCDLALRMNKGRDALADLERAKELGILPPKEFELAVKKAAGK